MSTQRRQARNAPPSDQPVPVTLPERARVLVIKAAGIGDLLLAVPALRALRVAYPYGQIDVLVTPQAAPLLRDSPLVTRVLVVDKSPFDNPHAVWHAPWRLAPLLGLWGSMRAAHYDAALLMHHLTLPYGRLKYRALLAAAHPALRVGLDNGYGGFLDVQVPDAGFGTQHEAAYCLDVAAAVGAVRPQPLLGPSLADLGWSTEDLGRTRESAFDDGEPLVAIHLGSGAYSRARRWPLDRYVALANALRRDFGARVLLIEGPDESELSEQFVGTLGRPAWVTRLANGLSLRESAVALAHCALFVGNDSLPMHLAAAAGTPVVAVFGPSNHRAWGPLPREGAVPAVVVRRDLPCSPCFYRGHSLGTPQGCPPRQCLEDLGIAPVLAEARKVLAARQPAVSGRPS